MQPSRQDGSNDSSFEDWAARGFADLVPVIPPLVLLSPNSAVPPSERGKVPGMRGAQGWFSYSWRDAPPATSADLARWHEMGASVGLRCGAVVAADNDVLDPGAAALLGQVAELTLGESPPRIGRAPKATRFYRTRSVLKKRRISFWLPGDDRTGKPHGVEVLASGQFSVLDGVHPGIGQPYAWPEGRPRLADLPMVDEDAIEAFMRNVELAVDMLGGEVLARATGAADSDRVLVDQEALRAPSLEVLEAALAHVANNGGYDDWIPGLCAIRAAATGLADDDGRELAREWTSRWEGGGQGAHIDFDAKWDQQHPPFRVGWGWVELRARAGGWKDGARLDFAGIDAPVLVPGSSARPTLGCGAESPASTGAARAAIAEMNQDHVFTMLGTKARIARDTQDDAGHLVWSFVDTNDMRKLYANQKVPRPEGKPMCRVQLWIESPDRRTAAAGVTFMPGGPEMVEGKLNLFRGWGVEPSEAGSCERYKAHLLDVVCGGNADHFAYLWRWLAHMIQKPQDKPGVAVVLRGRKGTGKSIIGEYIAPVLGPHLAALAQREHLLGRFNAHQASVLLLQAEEAVWAGDKQAEGVLKHMITSPSMVLEPKGVDAVQVRSCARVLFTSNEDWVVPASDDERRFFVLDVSEARRRDSAYFGALMAECKNGGASRLLHELQTLDLADFDARTAPRTEALADQVLSSLPPEVAWWRDCLHRGFITRRQRSFTEKVPGTQERGVVNDGAEWVPELRSDLLWLEAQEHARALRFGNFPTALNSLVRKLKPYLPDSFRQSASRRDFPPYIGDKSDALTTATRERVHSVPSLTECRKAFEDKIGRKMNWPVEDGDPGAPGGVL